MKVPSHANKRQCLCLQTAWNSTWIECSLFFLLSLLKTPMPFDYTVGNFALKIAHFPSVWHGRLISHAVLYTLFPLPPSFCCDGLMKYSFKSQLRILKIRIFKIFIKIIKSFNKRWNLCYSTCFLVQVLHSCMYDIGRSSATITYFQLIGIWCSWKMFVLCMPGRPVVLCRCNINSQHKLQLPHNEMLSKDTNMNQVNSKFGISDRERRCIVNNRMRWVHMEQNDKKNGLII